MKLYLATIDDTGYDEYDSVMVRAESKAEAFAFVTEIFHRDVYICADGVEIVSLSMRYSGVREDGSNVTVQRVREAGESGEIIASFNAG